MEAALVAFLAGLHPVVSIVLMVLGVLVVIAQTVVAITPSKADDAAWEKIKAIPFLGAVLSAVAAMAPIQKK